MISICGSHSSKDRNSASKPHYTTSYEDQIWQIRMYVITSTFNDVSRSRDKLFQISNPNFTLMLKKTFLVDQSKNSEPNFKTLFENDNAGLKMLFSENLGRFFMMISN